MCLGVFSDAHQRLRRDVIRNTWSRQAAHANVAVVFVISDHSPRRLLQTHARDLALARKEALEFGDVLFVESKAFSVTQLGGVDNDELPTPCILSGTQRHTWPESLQAATLKMQGPSKDLLHAENQELRMLAVFTNLLHVTRLAWIMWSN